MEERKVPKLRFKEFEDDWEEKKLKNFLTESRVTGSNGNLAKKLTVKLWGKGVVAKKEIHQGSDNTKYYIREKGQFIYGKLDFLNCAFGIIPEELDGYESTLDSPAFDIKNINSFFLFNTIIQKKFYKKNGDTANGSRKAKRIHVNIFLEMSIKITSLEEQERIANFLSNLDNLIEEQDLKVKDLESYKKGMMQKIFKQEIRFKDENGQDYADWEDKKLKEIGVLKSGICFSEKYQGHYNLPIKFFKVSDMNIKTNSKYMIVSNNTISYEILNEIKSQCIIEPSIIFAKVGAAIFLERKRIVTTNFLIDNNMMAFTPKDKYNIEFIYALMNTLHLSRYAQIGALPSYNASDISCIKVKIPSLEEQTKIANFLSNIDSILEGEKDILSNLKLLKKGLLQQMFI